MTVIARCGWAISAAFFLLVTSSVLHADHVGWAPAALVVIAIAICAGRPPSGLEILSALIPVSWYLMNRWNDNVRWAEVLACAAIAGLSIDAVRRPDRRMPSAIRTPALLFAIVVVSAVASGLAVRSLTLGPAFAGDIADHLTRAYFFEEAAYPGLHAGMLLVEGVLLFALAARLAAANLGLLARVAGGTVIGAALAGLVNVAHLLQSALRSDAVIPAVVNLSHSLRWNVEYPDFNAAGSFFVMALFVAIALLIASTANRRRWWTVCAIVVATALWLTGSRTAYVAAVLAAALALLARRTTGHARKRWIAAIALAGATVGIIAVIAFASPRRGNQGSSLAAADIRLQMAMVAGRMIETHPAYGIGLGEFHQRSGEFGTWDLYFKFPVSLNENAHNNFLQVAAELGLLGGIPFAWLVGSGLLVTARAARKKDEAGDPSELLIFAGLSAFVITWLAGHPLLIPEPAYVFWIALGAAAGAAEFGHAPVTRSTSRWLTAFAAAAILLALPFHTRTVMDDAELEHVGFGLSPHWMLSPDGIRYRAAEGHGIVNVPSWSAITFSVNPRASRPVRLELRLEHRVADVITLAPGQWTDVTLPKRADRKAPRFIPMDFRSLDGDHIEIWLTKVRPLAGR